MPSVDTWIGSLRTYEYLRSSLWLLTVILIVGAAPAAALELGSSPAVPPQVDPTTGALSLTVPIPIPLGPAMATPDLRLRYSSGRGHGPLGYGWDVPLGWIERSTRHGVPRCKGGHTDEFVLHLPDGSSDLAAIGPGLYQATIAGASVLLAVDPTHNRWAAFDAAGITYLFGGSSNARLFPGADVFLDADACEFTSVWGLTSTMDRRGNLIQVRYIKAGNTLYPGVIAYGGNATALPIVPHSYRIRFLGRKRQTRAISYHRAVGESLEYVLDAIKIEALIDPLVGFELISSYTLTHRDVEVNGRVLLERIEEDFGLVPTRTFDYTSSDFDYDRIVRYVPPAAIGRLDNMHLSRTISGSLGRTILDMNGDGFMDLVETANGMNLLWSVHLGSRGGFRYSGSQTPSFFWDRSKLWRVKRHQIEAITGSDPRRTAFGTLDLTGDGIPDFVDARRNPWTVYPGECSDPSACGFGEPVSWWAPEADLQLQRGQRGTDLVNTTKGLRDVNGDGLPDLVIAPEDTGHEWSVYLNSGSSFELASDFEGRGPLCVTLLEGSNDNRLKLAEVLDMNGDGLPDQVAADPLWAARVDADANILETFLIEDIFSQPPLADDEAFAGIVRVGFNTGGGFAPPEVMVTPMLGLTPPSLRRSLSGIGIGEMFDVNGDGLPDRVRTSASSSPFQVQLNHAGVLERPLVDRLGIGWGSWHATIFRVFAGSPGHPRLDDGRGNRSREIFDWNGDGFPDAVQADVVPWKIHLGGPADGSGVAPALMRCADDGQGTATRVDYGPRNAAGPSVTWEVTDLQPFVGSCFPEPGPVEPPLP